MGIKTDIQWCDSSVNPTSGCQGCELWIPGKGGSCYAGSIHTRFSPSKAYPGPFERITLHPGRMAKAARWPDLTGTWRPDKPWLDGLSRMIFLGDMADVLSDGVPEDYLRDEVIGNIESPEGRRHIWMLLTKRPARLAKLAHSLDGPWPEHLWVGTSVTHGASLTRIDHLLGVSAAVRFLSVEPLWEAVDLDRWLASGGIDLVIVGGQSGPGARPFDLGWARSIVAQCRKAGVATFCKQMGSHVVGEWSPGGYCPHHVGKERWKLRDPKGGDPAEWPQDLCVREFPEPTRAV